MVGCTIDVEFALDMGEKTSSPWKIWFTFDELNLMSQLAESEVLAKLKLSVVGF